METSLSPIDNIPKELIGLILIEAQNPEVNLVCRKWRQTFKREHQNTLCCGCRRIDQWAPKRDYWIGHARGLLSVTFYRHNLPKTAKRAVSGGNNVWYGWHTDGKPKYYEETGWRFARRVYGAKRGIKNIVKELYRWTPRGRLCEYRSPALWIIWDPFSKAVGPSKILARPNRRRSFLDTRIRWVDIDDLASYEIRPEAAGGREEVFRKVERRGRELFEWISRMGKGIAKTRK